VLCREGIDPSAAIRHPRRIEFMGLRVNENGEKSDRATAEKCISLIAERVSIESGKTS